MKQNLNKKVLSAILIPVAFIGFLGSKIYQYAAPQNKEKNCDFIYPRTSENGKQTNIILEKVEESINLEQTGGFINDASCLNKTEIYGIAKITEVEDVKNALQFARENKLKVTSAGQQHSMGGQSFSRGGLVLDMKSFNKMSVDKETKTLTVESGALWGDVQIFLDKEGLAVKSMQSINIFTVGGTLSVNAHGIDHQPGQIAPTVQSMRVMLSDGTIKNTSLTENTELFKSVLGGYGLFGVILDVQLNVVDNEVYEWEREYMDYKDFPKYYKESIEENSNIGLFFARISVSPTSYLKDVIVNKYNKTTDLEVLPKLNVEKNDWINRLVINFSKTGKVGRYTRWILEKYFEPSVHICSRNEAMSQKEVCVVSRNQEMYYSMGYLKNRLKDTDILQEYFIPFDNMPQFVDGLREKVQKNGANLLNVTIRVVHKDNITSIPYAKEDMFAFVLYFNQKFNDQESEILKQTTIDLIDEATSAGGTYYLPYQLYYSDKQLKTAYPEIDKFFGMKRKIDPEELFYNTFYDKYGKSKK